jgi:hypothetical protein
MRSAAVCRCRRWASVACRRRRGAVTKAIKGQSSRYLRQEFPISRGEVVNGLYCDEYSERIASLEAAQATLRRTLQDITRETKRLAAEIEHLELRRRMLALSNGA